MQAGVNAKYIILFAILIAITGFSFESQSNPTTKSPDNQVEVEFTINQP
ncbi:MAG: hypothetical protein KAU21_14470 [Gammaproteobacteria bacterium]|nr:hypothetical protein [Gammaproteobacteria bacterium]